MPRTKEQFCLMREKSRERILEAASELFTNDGFSNTSIEMIATRAGISKGLIYNYFKSKTDVLKAVIDRSFSEILTAVSILKNVDDPYEKLRMHLEESVASIKKNPQNYKLHFQLLSHPTTRPIIKEKLLSFITSISMLIENIFRSMGIKDPVAEAIAFGATFDGMVMRYILSDGLFPIDILKNRLIENYCSFPVKKGADNKDNT